MSLLKLPSDDGDGNDDGDEEEEEEEDLAILTVLVWTLFYLMCKFFLSLTGQTGTLYH